MTAKEAFKLSKENSNIEHIFSKIRNEALKGKISLRYESVDGLTAGQRAKLEALGYRLIIIRAMSNGTVIKITWNRAS